MKFVIFIYEGMIACVCWIVPFYEKKTNTIFMVKLNMTAEERLKYSYYCTIKCTGFWNVEELAFGHSNANVSYACGKGVFLKL